MRYVNDFADPVWSEQKSGGTAGGAGGQGADSLDGRMACQTEAAADYEDDTERFMRDLRGGVPIALLAAPAAVNSFDDYRQVFGYLRSLGVASFHSVLLRADITVWAYTELLRQQEQAAFLSSPCAAVTEYIRRCKPRLQPYLMPVYSPLLCAIIYLRTYRQLTGRVAFLSPCVAKRRELKTLETQGYNITIHKLQRYIAAHRIPLSQYEPVDFADRAEGRGVTLGVYGGLSESIAAHLPDRHFVKIGGPGKVYRWLDEYERIACAHGPLPHLAELYHCYAGCEGGTGISAAQKKGLPPVDGRWSALGRAADSHRCGAAQLFARFHQTLRLSDFTV